MDNEGTAESGSNESSEVTVRDAAEAAWEEHSPEPEESDTDSIESEDNTPDEVSEETDPDELEVEAQDESEEDETDPIEFPSVVSKALREKLKEAPIEAQQEIAEFLGSQQKSYSQKMRELSRVQQNYESLASTISPFEQSIIEDGDSIENRVSEMLTLDRRLDDDPINAIRQLCAECDVDPRQLIGGSSGGIDPRLAAYQGQHSQAEIELRQRQDAIEAKLQQQELQGRAQEATSAYEVWASQETSEGDLLRPHVKLLESQMVPVIAQMRSKDPNASHTDILQAAYDQVHNAYVKLNGAAKKKEVEGIKGKSSRAKKAASSIKGAPGGQVKQPGKQYKSVREAAEAAWNEHTH